MRILWIDDTPDIGLLRFLELEGFRLTNAETGAEGLERAQAGPYELVVLDLHLPDMHGLTVLERIRALGISTPVLVITGHYLDFETEGHARAAGASAFKYRPLWADEAVALLRATAGVSGSCAASPASTFGGSAALPSGAASGEMLGVRLLSALDRVALADDESDPVDRLRDALLRALLSRRISIV